MLILVTFGGGDGRGGGVSGLFLGLQNQGSDARVNRSALNCARRLLWKKALKVL